MEYIDNDLLNMISKRLYNETGEDWVLSLRVTITEPVVTQSYLLSEDDHTGSKPIICGTGNTIESSINETLSKAVRWLDNRKS